MENSFDIPHATTQFGTEPREADNSVEEMLWRHRELLAFLESQKMGSLGNPDPIVLDGTFTILEAKNAALVAALEDMYLAYGTTVKIGQLNGLRTVQTNIGRDIKHALAANEKGGANG